MTIKYAVWSAVSSEKQAAADKTSLSDQVIIAHKRAQAKNWTNTSLEYVVPGESRTRYVNLRDAENEIPQLKQMLDDAEAGKFQLLILYDYNRLRDLIDPVAKTLAAYGVQIYSCSQPTEPSSPDEFTSYGSDSESIMRGVSQILSRSQISDLQRKYAQAMPRRVLERGLPMRAPFGYIVPKPGQPAVIDPVASQACIMAKDMALAGKSLRQICDALHAEGYTGPRGGQIHLNTLRSILSNPFYAGLVFFRRTTTTTDPRTGKQKTQPSPPGRMIIGPGQHPPLWTIEEHEALLMEMSKRERTFIGRRANLFSGLLECGGCGKRMAIHFRQRRTVNEDGVVVSRPQAEGTYRCRGRQPDCARVPHPDLVKLVVDGIYRSIEHDNGQQDDSEILASDLADAVSRRDRITAAYAAGAFELDEYLKYKKPLDEEVKRLEGQVADQAGAQANRRQRAELVAYLRDHRDEFIGSLTDDENSQAANHTLRSIIEKVTVSTGPTVKIHFR